MRSWIAPQSGIVNISGWAIKSAFGGGDGVTVKVYKNEDIDDPLWEQHIEFNDSSYYEINRDPVTVVAGDKIRFHIDSLEDPWWDATQLDTIIIYVGEPSTLGAPPEQPNRQGR